MVPLHEMEGLIKHEICSLLDANGVWIELAALMQFDFQTINVSAFRISSVRFEMFVCEI